MSRSKRIVVDIDGVLAEFNAPFSKLLSTLGAAMRTGEPDRWNWFEAYGATRQQTQSAWEYVRDNPKWWGALPAHKDFTWTARERLIHLCEQEEVTFVTSRSGGRNETREWLEFHLPYVKQLHVVLTPREKALALIAMQPDVVIEDKLTTLEACVTPLKKCLKLLVNRAYNQGDVDGTGIVRVPSTLDALERVKAL